VICHCLVPNSDSVILATMDGTILSFDQVFIVLLNSLKSQLSSKHVFLL
jgi:hypothetical protein